MHGDVTPLTPAQQWEKAIKDARALKKKSSIPKVSPRSIGEETFVLHLKSKNIPIPVREYRFHPTRRWRFDFAWIDIKVAVEIEGGIGRYAQKSRHTSVDGFGGDLDKYNTATLMGWRILRFTTQDVMSGKSLLMVCSYFESISSQ